MLKSSSISRLLQARENRKSSKKSLKLRGFRGYKFWLILVLTVVTSAFIIVTNILAIPEEHAAGVTFLPEEKFLPSLLKDLDESKSEIMCALYMFRTDTLSASTRQVLGAMSNALERGVKVGVLFDVSDNKSDSTTKYNMHTGKILEKAGASVVYDDPDRRLHTKMCVIDREISYIGSHNYTFSGMEKNSEVSVRVRSKDMAREALEYLESRGLK